MDELTIEQLRSLARARQRAAQPSGEAPASSVPQSASRGTLGGVADTINDFNTGIGQALTLGFNDELSAGLAAPARVVKRAILGGDEGKGTTQRFLEAYSRGLEKQRAIVKTAEARSPTAEGAGELVGGVMTLAGGPGGNHRQERPHEGAESRW